MYISNLTILLSFCFVSFFHFLGFFSLFCYVSLFFLSCFLLFWIKYTKRKKHTIHRWVLRFVSIEIFYHHIHFENESIRTRITRSQRQIRILYRFLAQKLCPFFGRQFFSKFSFLERRKWFIILIISKVFKFADSITKIQADCNQFFPTFKRSKNSNYDITFDSFKSENQIYVTATQLPLWTNKTSFWRSIDKHRPYIIHF